MLIKSLKLSFEKLFSYQAFVLWGSLLTLSCSLTVKAQDSKNVNLSADKIIQITSLALPKASSNFNTFELEYVIDVMVHPSFRSPSLISLWKYRDGRLIAKRFDLANRNECLSDQLFKLTENSGSVTDETLIKQLNILETSIKVDGSFSQLVDSYFNKQSFGKETRITLDGVSYEIWYVDSGSKLHFSMIGTEKMVKTEPTLVTWARQIVAQSSAR